jgi:hypothetical protein
VPNNLSVSSYNPSALTTLTYGGVGAVQSTDLVSGASCYRYDVSNSFFFTSFILFVSCF